MTRNVIFALAFSFATLQAAFSQDEITIEGSGRYQIYLPIDGPNGRKVVGTLANELLKTNYYDLVTQGAGAYRVTGFADVNRLQASLIDEKGRKLFSRSYTLASAEANARALASDIHRMITGKSHLEASWIVFVSRQSGRKEIYACDQNGEQVRQLTQDGGISVSPSIDPKGNFFTYTSYRSGYPDVYRQSLFGSGSKRIAYAPGTNGGSSVSPNGRQIALTMSFSGNSELYVMGSGGGRPRSLTKTKATEASPTWSPDGREIIYVSDSTGSPQLYRVAANGGAPRRLNLGHRYCTEPVWSPDGRRLAFTAKTGGGLSVMIHDFATGRTRRFQRGEDPSWGPDSNHLVYTSNGALYRSRIDQPGEITRLTSLRGISEPSWSRSQGR